MKKGYLKISLESNLLNFSVIRHENGHENGHDLPLLH